MRKLKEFEYHELRDLDYMLMDLIEEFGEGMTLRELQNKVIELRHPEASKVK